MSRVLGSRYPLAFTAVACGDQVAAGTASAEEQVAGNAVVGIGVAAAGIEAIATVKHSVATASAITVVSTTADSSTEEVLVGWDLSSTASLPASVSA